MSARRRCAQLIDTLRPYALEDEEQIKTTIWARPASSSTETHYGMDKVQGSAFVGTWRSRARSTAEGAHTVPGRPLGSGQNIDRASIAAAETEPQVRPDGLGAARRSRESADTAATHHIAVRCRARSCRTEQDSVVRNRCSCLDEVDKMGMDFAEIRRRHGLPPRSARSRGAEKNHTFVETTWRVN